MANEKDEIIDSSNDDQAVLDDLAIGDDETDVAVIREKAQKAIDLAKNKSESNKQLFARTKKAEGFVLKDGKWVKPDPKPDAKPNEPNTPNKPEDKDSLTQMDVIALSKANIHEDDMQEVIEYAKFKKISIADALKSNVIISSLKKSVEERETAEATSSGKTRPANAAPSGEKLLEKAASTGELPDSKEGINSMLDARYENMKKKKR